MSTKALKKIPDESFIMTIMQVVSNIIIGINYSNTEIIEYLFHNLI